MSFDKFGEHHPATPLVMRRRSISPPLFVCGTERRSPTAIRFAPFWAVEKDPRREIIREILEPMFNSSRYKKYFARLDWPAHAIVPEKARSSRNDIELIPDVRSLQVDLFRLVDLDDE